MTLRTRLTLGGGALCAMVFGLVFHVYAWATTIVICLDCTDLWIFMGVAVLSYLLMVSCWFHPSVERSLFRLILPGASALVCGVALTLPIWWRTTSDQFLVIGSGYMGYASEDALIDAYIKAIKDDSNDCQTLGAALARLGASRTVRRLGALAIEDDNVMVRARVLWCLGEMGHKAKSTVPTLASALGDRETVVVWHAAYALSKLGPDAREAVPALVRVLQNGDESVCPPAAHALASIGVYARAALPALRTAAKAKDETLRDVAQRAIDQIEGAHTVGGGSTGKPP